MTNPIGRDLELRRRDFREHDEDEYQIATNRWAMMFGSVICTVVLSIFKPREGVVNLVKGEGIATTLSLLDAGYRFLSPTGVRSIKILSSVYSTHLLTHGLIYLVSGIAFRLFRPSDASGYYLLTVGLLYLICMKILDVRRSEFTRSDIDPNSIV